MSEMVVITLKVGFLDKAKAEEFQKNHIKPIMKHDDFFDADEFNISIDLVAVTDPEGDV